MTETATTTQKVAPRLKQRYADEIKGSLQEQFGFANVMQVPGVVKVVVNMGVGDAAKDSKLIEGAVRDLTAITGQKPSVTKARKSIAQFKLREGMPIGCHVTLRGDRMWEFLDRLVSVALPRIRDFRGLSPNLFDGLMATLPTMINEGRDNMSVPATNERVWAAACTLILLVLILNLLGRLVGRLSKVKN